MTGSGSCKGRQHRQHQKSLNFEILMIMLVA